MQLCSYPGIWAEERFNRKDNEGAIADCTRAIAINPRYAKALADFRKLIELARPEDEKQIKAAGEMIREMERK